jgi:hypothetical protein
MAESAALFERCLAAHGFDTIVSLDTTEDRSSFHIVWPVGETEIVERRFLTYDEDANLPESTVEKEIALMAEQTAREMKHRRTESITWGRDVGGRVDMNDVENTPPRAECPYCKTEAEIPDTDAGFGKQAEMSNPKPVAVEEETLYNSLEPHQKALLKIYLVGELRSSCNEDCPNRAERLIRE